MCKDGHMGSGTLQEANMYPRIQARIQGTGQGQFRYRCCYFQPGMVALHLPRSICRQNHTMALHHCLL